MSDEMSGGVRQVPPNDLLCCDILIQLLSCESFTLPVHVYAG